MDDPPLETALLVRAFRRMQKRLERLATRLSDACEGVDAAAKGIEDLVERLSGTSELRPRRRSVRSPDERRIMRAEAEAGASSVHIVRHADGTQEVSVNSRAPFPLAPKLAALLAILAAPGEVGDDGLPAWQTRAELATALNRKTGGTVAPGAVPRLVFKLREAFREGGENWFLICTNRRFGVRLALRR